MIMMQLIPKLALAHDNPPHLDTNMLLPNPPPAPDRIPNPNPNPNLSLNHPRPSKRDRIPVQIVPLRRAGDFQESGGEVCVRGDEVRGVADWDVGTADQEGDVDVFFVGALFSRLQAVLADVIAIITGDCVLVSLGASKRTFRSNSQMRYVSSRIL